MDGDTRCREEARDQVATRTLAVADLGGLVEELPAYHAHFAPLYRRREQRVWRRSTCAN